MKPFFEDGTSGECYRLLRDHPSRAEEKEHVEKLWEKYHEYAEKELLDEVKDDAHFTQRMWELYLGAIFADNGILEKQNSKDGPDFKLCIDQTLTWVEATAPKKGSGPDAVPDFPHGPTVPNDEVMLRITSSIEEKFRQYNEHIKMGVVSDEDPYVVAINTSEAYPFDGPDIPRILKVAFGIGHQQLIIDMESREVTETRWSRMTEIQKRSGNAVETAYFNDPSYSGISAIVYSTENILHIPEGLGDDCLLVHNPLAKNPVSLETFDYMEQWAVHDDGYIKKVE